MVHYGTAHSPWRIMVCHGPVPTLRCTAVYCVVVHRGTSWYMHHSTGRPSVPPLCPPLHHLKVAGACFSENLPHGGRHVMVPSRQGAGNAPMHTLDRGCKTHSQPYKAHCCVTVHGCSQAHPLCPPLVPLYPSVPRYGGLQRHAHVARVLVGTHGHLQGAGRGCRCTGIHDTQHTQPCSTHSHAAHTAMQHTQPCTEWYDHGLWGMQGSAYPKAVMSGPFWPLW